MPTCPIMVKITQTRIWRGTTTQMTCRWPRWPWGGGNTSSPPKKEKRGSGAKNWGFVWNNYPENWLALLAPILDTSVMVGWVAGYEVGASGTPHLQGYIEFQKKTRPIGYLGTPKEIHWGDANGKAAKASRGVNVKYCLKDGKKAGGTFKRQRENPVIDIYGWQEEMWTKLQEEPDDRTVHWVWSTKGSRGKSSFARFLVSKGALICSGKAADMKFMIKQFIEKSGEYPEIVVLDVPRSSFQYLSYTGIEEIKNGVFCSSKYETGMVEMPYPHVLVMANFAPDYGDVDMSSDRYSEMCVDE